jgi:hypothetical protein
VVVTGAGVVVVMVVGVVPAVTVYLIRRLVLC